ncbi:MAG: phospho-sugar mutase [Oscillospiraceae bacterium]|nr:phospho-sugar mutase [Oscillospiraceae bacterium]
MTKERQLYNRWLEAVEGDSAYLSELKAIENDETEIGDRFYRDLEFGTAGLRGVLGLGTNRMNVFTVRRVTQGFSMYLKEIKASPCVAIAYDSRINSALFAREAACVFAANGIKAWLYRELMPTPALSYAVRELGCDAGVVVTASHNPAKYNGYKTYGSDGCQIGPIEAARILALTDTVDYFSGVSRMDLSEALASGMAEYIPDEFIEKYISRVFDEAIRPEVCAKAGLKLVYTPLNGAGRRCVTAVLNRLGVKDVSIVKEQEMPDGNFPTCPYPNPEIREALDLGLKLCEESGADMLLATDPDADRVAVAVKQTGGGYRILTGNEAGVLLLDYIARARKEKGTLPKKPIAVKSIVSSKLADAVAGQYGVELIDVLTGFKFIGEVILGLEEKGEEDRFIFGFEESCGYLSGPFVRDKDAVNASLLLVEMASAYKPEGRTLCDRLDEIYKKHGVYVNHVSNFAFEGADGMAEMAAIMKNLRDNPPVKIAGAEVIYTADYSSSIRTENGSQSKITLPPSNVLEYGLSDGCTVIVRPSGTEPKIKIYYSFVAKTHEETEKMKADYCDFCERMIGIQ